MIGRVYTYGSLFTCHSDRRNTHHHLCRIAAREREGNILFVDSVSACVCQRHARFLYCTKRASASPMTVKSVSSSRCSSLAVHKQSVDPTFRRRASTQIELWTQTGLHTQMTVCAVHIKGVRAPQQREQHNTKHNTLCVCCTHAQRLPRRVYNGTWTRNNSTHTQHCIRRHSHNKRARANADCVECRHAQHIRATSDTLSRHALPLPQPNPIQTKTGVCVCAV